MKIFQLIDNPHVGNPYVLTLMDGISDIDKEFQWGYGVDAFWTDDILQYDIVHIHWPHIIVNRFSKSSIIKQFEQRLIFLKQKDIKIVVTCHNLKPHYETDTKKIDTYRIAYEQADCILHLGEYSLKLMQEKYPNSKHFLLLHHTYDKLYSVVGCEESKKKLHLNLSKKYILCFGDFRDNEERRLVDIILKHYYSQCIEIIAPLYYKQIKRRNKLKMILTWIQLQIKKITTKGLHIYGKFVEDDLLPYYYGVADICLIHRKQILNSGNLPMAFYMGKIVVGPNVGNVGQILEQTGNPTFNPEDNNSIFAAINSAFSLYGQGKGIKNKEYAQENLTTEIISKKLYNIYQIALQNFICS